MNPANEIDKLLKADGAVLKRKKNHNVWQLSNGQNFVRSLTPSDWRGDLNNLSDLKKCLGIVDPERGKPGERREKKVPVKSTVMREKLAAVGIVEPVEVALRNQVEELIKENNTLRRYYERCWCKHIFGLWRRGIARLPWAQKISGSSPDSPTK